jgi:hypothetical protein
MVVLIKRTVHSCPNTGMLYLYPAELCPLCKGRGLNFKMTTDEMHKENVRRHWEKYLKEH